MIVSSSNIGLSPIQLVNEHLADCQTNEERDYKQGKDYLGHDCLLTPALQHFIAPIISVSNILMPFLTH